MKSFVLGVILVLASASSPASDLDNSLISQLRQDARILVERYPDEMGELSGNEDKQVEYLILKIEKELPELIAVSKEEKEMLSRVEFPVSPEQANAAREELQRAVGDKLLPAILRYYRNLDELTPEQALIQFRLCRSYLEA